MTSSKSLSLSLTPVVLERLGYKNLTTFYRFCSIYINACSAVVLLAILMLFCRTLECRPYCIVFTMCSDVIIHNNLSSSSKHFTSACTPLNIYPFKIDMGSKRVPSSTCQSRPTTSLLRNWRILHPGPFIRPAQDSDAHVSIEFCKSE